MESYSIVSLEIFEVDCYYGVAFIFSLISVLRISFDEMSVIESSKSILILNLDRSISFSKLMF